METLSSEEIRNILFMFAGGLGLFIYGMRLMGDGLQKAAGPRLKRLLEILTANRFLGVIMGTAVTAVIQSSSATTVMVIGFVNAGLMNLAQATGVIMGANIGTTFTSQLVAFKLTNIAPVAILIGVSMIMFSKKKTHKRYGEIITGFGILFFGMGAMSDAVKPLRENQMFIDMIMEFQNPFLGVFAGFAITAILQSSSASIGIIQALALNGIINIDIALPIILGQNIGTCVTAMISSVGACKIAKRAALIHLLFNVIGTSVFLLGLSFIPFGEMMQKLSNEPVRQIAHAHTIFNIVNTIILFPFAGLMVKLSESIITGADCNNQKGLRFLDERILETPSIAVQQTIKEVMRMAEMAKENFELSMNALFNEDEKIISEVLEREETINFLNRELNHYLVKISELSLS